MTTRDYNLFKNHFDKIINFNIDSDNAKEYFEFLDNIVKLFDINLINYNNIERKSLKSLIFSFYLKIQ